MALQYRDANGAFVSRAQLKKVPRLGEKTFEQAAGFLRVMNGDNPLDASAVRRVLLCSGKVSYDLLAAREAQGTDDVAVLRVEQLYPLPASELQQALGRYPNAAEVFWVQEEPANQGPWPFLGLWLPEVLPGVLGGLRRISRRAMSAPSSGSSKVHAVEQQEIIDEAFAE